MIIEKQSYREFRTGRTTDDALPAIECRHGVRLKAIGAASVGGFEFDELFIPVDDASKIVVSGTAAWIVA